MAHKYLNDIGIKNKDLPWAWQKNDKRSEQWKAERNKYGFDDRDTWNLDYTLSLLIYERLMMYKDNGFIDMHWDGDKYEYRGKELYMDEALEVLVDFFKRYIQNQKIDTDVEELKDVFNLFGRMYPGLWW